MLYGIRMKLQKQMLEENKNLLVYVPWGSNAKGYFMRRVLEGIQLNALILVIGLDFDIPAFICNHVRAMVAAKDVNVYSLF